MHVLDLHCTDMAESPVRVMVAVRARLLRCELRNHKPLFGSLRLSQGARAPLLHNLHFWVDVEVHFYGVGTNILCHVGI